MALLEAGVVRPLVLAAAAWLILRVLRVRHPASQHAVWTTVLIGMLPLPVASVVAPHWKLPVLPRRHESRARAAGFGPAALAASEALDSATQRAASAGKPAVREAPTMQTLVLWCYAAGLSAMVAYRVVGWLLLWRVVARSRPLRVRWLRESDDVLAPVAVGALHPAVILPAEWRTWNATTRKAVLAHEFAHLRRRDALVAALARLVQGVFWFHPLAWWISRQISELAELACDAAVLEKVDDPAGYSRILLAFAETVNRAGYRAVPPGLAMAASSGMGRRIDAVFELADGLADGRLRKLARPGAMLALVGVPVIGLAATMGLGEPSAPSARFSAPWAPAPATARPQATAQSSAPAAPKFEVASIKPCKAGDGGRGGNGSGGGVSPGRLNLPCETVADLVKQAYITFANGHRNGPPPDRIAGGPPWVNSDRYTISAKAEGAASQETMNGPMLQALLEDRFQLKIHRESREVPVYVMTVGKNGLKLQRVDEASCHPDDVAKLEAALVAGQKPFRPCNSFWFGKSKERPGLLTAEAHGISIEAFFQDLSHALDRPVLDKTGITGRFDFRMEFAPDETTPGFLAGGAMAKFADRGDAPGDLVVGPSILAAIQEQLGLKLEPAKGPGEFLVIDHIERPSEN